MQAGENVEIEIKLRWLGPMARADELIRELGFEVAERRVLEVNVVFDTPDRRLRENGKLIRLRRAGRKGVFTYKGPAETGLHKSREEIELEVSEPGQLELILERLGYLPSFRYEKFRTEYHISGQPGTVTLDETPVGNYLEIEGRPEWIDNTARALGFSVSDYITESYASLYRSYCVERGLEPSDMIFRS